MKTPGKLSLPRCFFALDSLQFCQCLINYLLGQIYSSHFCDLSQCKGFGCADYRMKHQLSEAALKDCPTFGIIQQFSDGNGIILQIQFDHLSVSLCTCGDFLTYWLIHFILDV